MKRIIVAIFIAGLICGCMGTAKETIPEKDEKSIRKWVDIYHPNSKDVRIYRHFDEGYYLKFTSNNIKYSYHCRDIHCCTYKSSEEMGTFDKLVAI